MLYLTHQNKQHIPWNKGKLTGQKPPLKLAEIWAIRTRLQIGQKTRDLALFNLAIDSKLRSCDLVKLRVRDIVTGGRVSGRATVLQQKTNQPVQFEITKHSRESIKDLIDTAGLTPTDFLFKSRVPQRPSFNASVRSYSEWLGRDDRPRSSRLWHPHDATN